MEVELFLAVWALHYSENRTYRLPANSHPVEQSRFTMYSTVVPCDFQPASIENMFDAQYGFCMSLERLLISGFAEWDGGMGWEWCVPYLCYMQFVMTVIPAPAFLDWQKASSWLTPPLPSTSQPPTTCVPFATPQSSYYQHGYSNNALFRIQCLFICVMYGFFGVFLISPQWTFPSISRLQPKNKRVLT